METNTDGIVKDSPLLAQLRYVIRRKHYSIRTEQAYLQWTKRFILYHGKKHPKEMGAPEVEKFLTYLAVGLNVAASTQNQALNAIVFLYTKVLQRQLGKMENIAHAKGHGEAYLPYALARKYPSAAKDWAWQYVFYSIKTSVDPRSGKIRRHHLDESTLE